MSSVQIPNLGAVISLNGSELFECVQSGVSKKVSSAQIIQFPITPAGFGVLFAAWFNSLPVYPADPLPPIGQFYNNGGTLAQVQP